MSVLKTRAITALFFVIIMLSGLWISAWTQYIILALAGIGCLFEFNKHMLGQIQTKYKDIRLTYNILIGFFPVLLAMPGASTYAFEGMVSPMILAAILFIILVSIGLTIELADLQDKPFYPVSTALAGTFYIGGPIAAAIFLSNYTGTFNRTWVLILFALIWSNDTLAYLSGSKFGKTPFAPGISPKKTWEGTLGGALFCVLVALSLPYLAGAQSMPFYAGLGLLVAITGTTGDLVESRFKRSLQIKDSGSIMPGHGGFLDRFDSFLFVAPWASLYILMLSQ